MLPSNFYSRPRQWNVSTDFHRVSSPLNHSAPNVCHGLLWSGSVAKAVWQVRDKSEESTSVLLGERANDDGIQIGIDAHFVTLRIAICLMWASIKSTKSLM